MDFQWGEDKLSAATSTNVYDRELSGGHIEDYERISPKIKVALLIQNLLRISLSAMNIHDSMGICFPNSH